MMQLAAALLKAEQPLFTLQEATGYSESCGLSLQDGLAFLLASAAGLSPESSAEDRELLERWLRPSLHESNPAPYREDLYYKTVPFHGQTQGKWCYGRETIIPMELFVEGDMVLTAAGRVLPQLGFFRESYSFPAVFENGRDWMSLAPNETVTLRAPIEAAEGRVLTYGLGLGYYPFMTAQKEEVKSVTVVEREQTAIDLFKQNLLPHFPHKEKITVLQADALEFAAALKPGAYDCVFADIWRDAGDGMPLYQSLKAYEACAPGTRFDYWIQKSMDLYLQASLWY